MMIEFISHKTEMNTHHEEAYKHWAGIPSDYIKWLT